MANKIFYKSKEEKILFEAVEGAFDKSRKKSSRSKADLFELLLVKELNKYYRLSFPNLDNEIKKILNKIKTFKDSLYRIEEQKNRIKFLLPALIEELDKLKLINGKPIEISWVGRKWQKNKTLSDIKVKFTLGKSIGISTKSTRSGTGTQKNIGLKELKKYLDLNIDQELLNMKNNIILKVAQQNKQLNEIAKGGITLIRKNKYRFPVIQMIGKEFGIPVQTIAVNESVKKFNKLDYNKKKKFIDFILGFKEEEQLLNAFISGKQSKVYWNKNLNNLIGQNLKAIEGGDKGYFIVSDGKNIIRIQVNFTNGIGISAFCERAFL